MKSPGTCSAFRAAAFAMLLVSASRVSAADYLAMSGADLYGRFCAACHGATAHGDGPVAPSFRFEVPDLTLIAHRQGGKFDRERVERIIDGRAQIASHGSRAMPVWGEEFARAELGNPNAEAATRTMIDRLVRYIESLQVEPQPPTP